MRLEYFVPADFEIEQVNDTANKLDSKASISLGSLSEGQEKTKVLAITVAGESEDAAYLLEKIADYVVGGWRRGHLRWSACLL